MENYKLLSFKGFNFGIDFTGGTDITITNAKGASVKSINKDTMVIVSSDYGLTKVKDKGISLIEKKKEFIIEKNKPVEITTQTTDYNESMIIEWR